MMWLAYDNDGVAHLAHDDMRLGTALCGYPPMRARTGEPWKTTDRGIQDVEPAFLLEEVTCTWCKHAVDMSQVALA